MKTLKYSIPILVTVIILATSQVVSGKTESYSTISSVRHEIASQVIETSHNNEYTLIPDDKFSDKQWALASLGISGLWQITMGSEEVLVAILDTGIDKNHEDLRGKIKAEVNFTDTPDADDIHGHGTHIAGIIAAENNDIGIIGLAPDCRLLNIKVADDRGRCDVQNLVKGIIWAVDNGASVINISIEIKENSPELEAAIDYAWKNGALVVAAAGNSGSQNPVYPAYYQNCIAVTAVKEDNSLSPLSNRGSWVDLAAPGYQIYSTLPGDSYGYETGTSFASAHVSGIAALLFTIVIDSNGNGFLNDEVLTIIKDSCKEIVPDGTGWGYIEISQIVAQ
ncbi:MAG: S8 family serine peptidase [Chloroflexota bacterium]